MTDTQIHPTALVDPAAKIGPGVTVGPYAMIGAGVELGEGCQVGHHATLEGPSRIGARNIFFPYAAIGFKTQDLKYRGEPTYLEIGDGNLFLAYTHVAHNCFVGNHTIFSNNATLAGHVVVGDHVVISGLSAVHQFCRIGAHAIIGGCTKIVQDVPPYLIADGNPAHLRGVNHVGLERRGFTEGDIKTLRRAYRTVADKTLNFSQAVEKIAASEDASNSHVQALIEFFKTTQRGVVRPEPLAG
jgi:UDP-N-acetylglucosamine acyltransferase